MPKWSAFSKVSSGTTRNHSQMRRWDYQSFMMYDDKDELAFRAILAANLAVFMNWQLGFPLSRENLVKYFTASTAGVYGQKNVLSLVGASFSHFDLGHLFVNMLTFYFFGKNVFLSMGRQFAVPMYLIAGAAGSYAQVREGWVNRYNSSVIGASGAVSSFVIFSILQNPRATVLIYFVVPIPAALFGLLYVLQDVYAMRQRNPNGSGISIGHSAHLAGSLVGGLAYLGRRWRFF